MALLTKKELAERWQVTEKWIDNHSRPDEIDPIPHFNMGRYKRFEERPELFAWLERRLND